MAPSPSVFPSAAPIRTKDLVEHELFESIATVIAGDAGLDRIVDHPRIQKSGLVLAGHAHGIVSTRVQVLGETEISFIEALDPAVRVEPSLPVASPCELLSQLSGPS